MEFNNKITIQWGQASTPDSTESTISLPIAYTNAKYKVILSKSDGWRYGNAGQSWTSLVSQTTTTFKVRNNVVNKVQWISIGY